MLGVIHFISGSQSYKSCTFLCTVGCFCYTRLLQNLTLKELNEMSTASKENDWLELVTQCRTSGLTDRQWCIENGIAVSTFYYHVRALRKKACAVPEAANTSAQKQEVVQIPLWKTEQNPSGPIALSVPSVCLEIQGIRVEIHEQAGADVIRNTLLALRQLC